MTFYTCARTDGDQRPTMTLDKLGYLRRRRPIVHAARLFVLLHDCTCHNLFEAARHRRQLWWQPSLALRISDFRRLTSHIAGHLCSLRVLIPLAPYHRPP